MDGQLTCHDMQSDLKKKISHNCGNEEERGKKESMETIK